MRLLLDTHVLVWWLADSPKLSRRVREAVSARANAVFVSAASAWEISTKVRIGKWPEAVGLAGLFLGVIEANGFEPLAITVRHAAHAGALAVEHPDPFDRMLAAQAELDDMAIVTLDPAFARFNVSVIW